MCGTPSTYVGSREKGMSYQVRIAQRSSRVRMAFADAKPQRSGKKVIKTNLPKNFNDSCRIHVFIYYYYYYYYSIIKSISGISQKSKFYKFLYPKCNQCGMFCSLYWEYKLKILFALRTRSVLTCTIRGWDVPRSRS